MDFETNYDKLLASLTSLILNEISFENQKLKAELKKEIEFILNNLKAKLKKWTVLLSTKKIDLDEFKWLINSQKDLVFIHSLYQVGLTKNKIGRIKRDIMHRIFYDLSKFKY